MPGSAARLPFVLLYLVFTVFMLPGWILTVAAGALFGLLGGLVTVSIGSTLGVAAAVTMYITRLARRAIRQQAGSAQEIAKTDEPTSAEDQAPRQASLLSTLTLAGLALAMLVLTAWAYLNADRLRNLVGPPVVVMVEVYEPRSERPRFDRSGFDAILAQHVNNNGGVDDVAWIAGPEPRPARRL